MTTVRVTINQHGQIIEEICSYGHCPRNIIQQAESSKQLKRKGDSHIEGDFEIIVDCEKYEGLNDEEED